MNQKQAKRLRRIARGLGLTPKNTYAPVGELKRREGHTYKDQNGITQHVPGQPIPRPFALTECERRAYQEAKKLYAHPETE